MLAGRCGPAAQKAMEIVVSLGQIYEAEDLVPVASVQVAGVSYKNLGKAGLEFLQGWARQGAKVRVPTTLNPAGMDLEQELGFPEDFARRQAEIIAAFREMGVTVSCTCAPYLVGNPPRFGEHLAWSESSAVSFANSILGARTNREGGPGALAAAIAGRTARYGLHLEENRRPTHIVEVRCPMKSEADYGALGHLVGKMVGGGVPYFRGMEDGGWTIGDKRYAIRELRALGAAMAASGAVALYHIEGITPEARRGIEFAPGAKTFIIESLAEAYAALNTSAEAVRPAHDEEEIDFVALGCPHASLMDIEEIASWVKGQNLKARLWVTTARQIKEEAARRGLVKIIEEAGGRVVADTCMVVAPVEVLGLRRMATNSAKAAFYAPSHCGLEVRFGPLEMCLEAALTGRWPGGGQGATHLERCMAPGITEVGQ